MADAALLNTLEALREQYAQRRKSAATVLMNLKGTAGSLGKVAKALREYSDSAGEPAARSLEVLTSSRLRHDAIDPKRRICRRYHYLRRPN